MALNRQPLGKGAKVTCAGGSVIAGTLSIPTGAYGSCSTCGRTHRVRADGQMYKHQIEASHPRMQTPSSERYESVEFIRCNRCFEVGDGYYDRTTQEVICQGCRDHEMAR